MGEVVGAVSLGIQVTETSIKVISFIIDVVVNTKNYGNGVTALRSRISAENARIETFLAYLKQRTADDKPKLVTLHVSCQNAVVLLIQELEVAFAAFSAYMKRHDIDALKRGYVAEIDEKALDAALDAKVLEIKRIKGDTPRLDRLVWSLFQKRKVLELVNTLEAWNDRLMNVLLCDAVFGPANGTQGEDDHASIQDRILDAGLSLKAIMDKQDPSHAAAARMIDPTGTLEEIDLENRMATLSQGDKSRTVFVEFKPFELKRRAKEPSESVKARVENLAQLLAHEEAHAAGFNALHCIAVVRATEKAFAFAFALPPTLIPEGGKPISLLSAISSKKLHRPTLNERFAMARVLVQTVFQLHSVDWLHKSIRSENVIFGYREDPLRPTYGHPLLVGFEYSRSERDTSSTEYDDKLERNIYRHPDRQGLPEDRFNALYDIYSLGVVLLEIGLWRVAAQFEKNYEEIDPKARMDSLQEHAKDRLPHYMGVDYKDAVLACLSCTLLPDKDPATISAGLTDTQRLDLNLSLLGNVLNKFTSSL